MDFKFPDTVPLPYGAIESAALGVNAAGKLSDADINKACKLAANDNYVIVSDGNDLEAVVVAIDPATVNDGFSFGSVQRRFYGLVAINKDVAALTVGAAVVCAAQAAIGTPQAAPYVKAGAGTLFRWRVKSLMGGGGATDEEVLLEPITR